MADDSGRPGQEGTSPNHGDLTLSAGVFGDLAQAVHVASNDPPSGSSTSASAVIANAASRKSSQADIRRLTSSSLKSSLSNLRTEKSVKFAMEGDGNTSSDHGSSGSHKNSKVKGDFEGNGGTDGGSGGGSEAVNPPAILDVKVTPSEDDDVFFMNSGAGGRSSARSSIVSGRPSSAMLSNKRQSVMAGAESQNLSSTFVSFIQANRIMNQQTTVDSAQEKALFWDAVGFAANEGDDDMNAIDKGNQAIKAYQDEKKRQKEEAEALAEEAAERAASEKLLNAGSSIAGESPASTRKSSAITTSPRVQALKNEANNADANRRGSGNKDKDKKDSDKGTNRRKSSIVDVALAVAATRRQSQMADDGSSARESVYATTTSVPMASTPGPPGSTIHSDYDHVPGAQPTWPDFNSPKHPRFGHGYRKSLGGGSLKGFVNKIVRPSVKTTINDGFDWRDIDMSTIRVMHKKLMFAIDDYDYVTQSDSNARASGMLESYKQSVENVEVLTRKKVAAEYEKRINHHECDAQIHNLRKENKIMKEETSRTMTLNSELSKEVEDLRLFKSNAEAETKILLGDVAKRRLQCSALRRRLKLSIQRSEEAERYAATVEAELAVAHASLMAAGVGPVITPRVSVMSALSNYNSFSDTKLATANAEGGGGGANNMATPSTGNNIGRLSRAFWKRRRSSAWAMKGGQHQRSDDENTDGGGVTNSDSEGASGHRSRTGRDVSDSERDDTMDEEEEVDEDDDINEEEWEQWCKETEFSKPTWNRSTATKLLSQAPPPSVIHIGENPLAGLAEAVETVAATSTSSNTTGAAVVAAVSGAATAMNMEITEDSAVKKMKKDEFLAKVHNKCHKKIQKIRDLLENERMARKQLTIFAGKKSKLLNLLEDCLRDELCRTGQTISEVNQEESEVGAEARQSFLHSLQARENLLRSLIIAVSSCDQADASKALETFTNDFASTRGSPSPQTTSPRRKIRPQSAGSRTSNGLGSSSIWGSSSYSPSPQPSTNQYSHSRSPSHNHHHHTLSTAGLGAGSTLDRAIMPTLGGFSRNGMARASSRTSHSVSVMLATDGGLTKHSSFHAHPHNSNPDVVISSTSLGQIEAPAGESMAIPGHEFNERQDDVTDQLETPYYWDNEERVYNYNDGGINGGTTRKRPQSAPVRKQTITTTIPSTINEKLVQPPSTKTKTRPKSANASSPHRQIISAGGPSPSPIPGNGFPTSSSKFRGNRNINATLARMKTAKVEGVGNLHTGLAGVSDSFGVSAARTTHLYGNCGGGVGGGLVGNVANVRIASAVDEFDRRPSSYTAGVHQGRELEGFSLMGRQIL
ncbi:hypothetical protein HDU76_007478 [Blyttiomyces sp. JEL0837]|nr:hypothetical protein HDU76_007478 [Blyttiomyces sp. JEL0837]